MKKNVKIIFFIIFLSIVFLFIIGYYKKKSFETRYQTLLEFVKLKKQIVVSKKTIDFGIFKFESSYVRALEINSDLSVDVIKAINDLTKLEVLILTNTNITDETLKQIRFPKSLKVLDLVNTDITGKSLLWISENCDLEHLDITATRICNSDLKHLNSLRNLKFLRLSMNHLDEQLFNYFNNYSIEHLNLDHLPMSNLNVSALKSFKNLKKLEINYSGINENIHKQLKEKLKGVEVDCSKYKFYAPKDMIKIPEGPP